jgi:hypothetical protein
MLRDFKISFYMNLHTDKLFRKQKKVDNLSSWVSLCIGMMDVGQW